MSVGDPTTVLINGHVPRCAPTATPGGRKSMPLVNGAHSTSSAFLLRSLYSNSNTAPTAGTGTTTETEMDRGNPVATAAAPLLTSSPSPGPYAALLMDTCEYNRGLSRHRVERLPFLDLATQISQRPAPWLYRSHCDRSPNSFVVYGTHVVIRYLRHRWRLDHHDPEGHFHGKRRRPMATADLGGRQPFALLQSDGGTVCVADPDPLYLSGQSSCSLTPTGASHHWPSIGRFVDRCASNGDHQKSISAQKDYLETGKKPTSASERDEKTGAVMISVGEDSLTSSSLEPVSRRPTPDLEDTKVRTQVVDEEQEDGSKSRSRNTSCLLGVGDQEEFDDDAGEEEVEEVDAEGEEDAVVGEDVELEEVDEDLVDEDEGGLLEQQDEDPDDEDVEWHQSRSSRGQSGLIYGRRPGGRRRLRGCKAATAGCVKMPPGSDNTGRRQQRMMQKKQSTTASRRGTTCSRKTSRQSRSDSRTRSAGTTGSTGRRGASTGNRNLLTSSSSSHGQGFSALTQPSSSSHRRRGDRAFESTWESDEPGFQPNAAIPSFLLSSDSRAGPSPSRSTLTSGVVTAPPPPTAPVTIPPRHFQEVPSRHRSSSTVSLPVNNNNNNNSTPSSSDCLLSSWHHPSGPVMASSDLGSVAPESQLAANYSPCQQPYHHHRQQQHCLSGYNYHQQRHHLNFTPSSVRPTISHMLSTSTGSSNAVLSTSYSPYFGGQVTRTSLPEARLRDGGGPQTTALTSMLASAHGGGVNLPVQSEISARDNRSASGYFPTSTTTTEAGSQSFLETVHGNTYRQLIPSPSPVESCGPQPVACSSASSVGTDSADAGGSTTVVTFFVCEVCSSRYRSTAGLRYHYHSQHSGYTPKNPISASASRLVVPLGEERAIGGGLRGGRPRRHKPYSDSKSKARTKEVVTNSTGPSGAVGCALSSLPVDSSMPTPTVGSSETRFPPGATSLAVSTAPHSGLDDLMTDCCQRRSPFSGSPRPAKIHSSSRPSTAACHSLPLPTVSPCFRLQRPPLHTLLVLAATWGPHAVGTTTARFPVTLPWGSSSANTALATRHREAFHSPRWCPCWPVPLETWPPAVVVVA